MIHALFQIAHYLLGLAQLVIIVQVIFSWLLVFNVLNTSSHGVRAFATALDRITAPVYRPFRKILPDLGGIDLSPLLAWIVIQVLQMLLTGAENSILYGSP